ncbi:MAG: DUF2142 domain-containing protein [Planctomycetaceae bacterium]|nr:DUF2142 domain-containing protein [Planctomycetaceae bacterium]
MICAKTEQTDVNSRRIVIALCVIGGLRILFFCLIFPFFNAIDEKEHFDLIYKYSRGSLPGHYKNFSSKTIQDAVIYGSPEYLSTDTNSCRPLWRQEDFVNSDIYVKLIEKYKKKINYEISSPPVYYFLAGMWYRAGEILGISDAMLVFWTRLINVPVFMALIWFSWRLAQICFSNVHQQLAVPLLLAFFPQDVFYTLSSDTLPPLLFVIFFLMAIRIYFENMSLKYHFFAGLLAAALFLTRMPNAALLMLVLVIIILKIKKERTSLCFFRIGILLSAFLVPVSIWMIRNYFVFGDLAGIRYKAKYWGWTPKPFNQLWNHPFFLDDGISQFFTSLIETFWRGELAWHWNCISSNIADQFYIKSSIIFTAIFLFIYIYNYKKNTATYHIVMGLSFLVIAAAIFLQAFASILYDYHNCLSPSRDRPYFVAGRVISSVLVPFLLIYIDGIWKLFGKLGSKAVMLMIALMVITITISEFWLTRHVFTSPYNWFALFRT